MKLEFLFPDMKALNAHAKGNSHFAKSAATKQSRTLAKFICLDMLNRKQVHPIVGRVLLSYAFYVPSDHRRDAANMIQAMKPTIDGIVDAGLIEGDHWQVLTIYNVSVEIDKKNPRVEISISAADSVGDLIHKVPITRPATAESITRT